MRRAGARREGKGARGGKPQVSPTNISGRRGGGGRCVRGRGEGDGSLRGVVFASRARSPSVQCSRGDGRAHDARARRRVRREVLGSPTRDAPRRARSGRGRGPARRASIPPTTLRCIGSTTSARSSSRSTSSHRSSTIRAPSARSPRRTRSTTSSRWAARRSSLSRSLHSRRSCRSRRSAKCSPAPTSVCAPQARSWLVATPFATPSRSTGSPSSAPSIPTESGRSRGHVQGTLCISRSVSARGSCSRRSATGSRRRGRSRQPSLRCSS